MAAVGVYFVGYSTPAGSSGRLHRFIDPDRVLAYLRDILAESWHFIAPVFGPIVTVIALLGTSWFFVRKLRRPERLEPVQGFALSVVLHVLLTAFITALGQEFGAEQARVGRYQTPAMLFWWALVLFVVSRLTHPDSRLRMDRRRVFLALQVVFIGVFLAEERGIPNAGKVCERRLHAEHGWTGRRGRNIRRGSDPFHFPGCS